MVGTVARMKEKVPMKAAVSDLVLQFLLFDHTSSLVGNEIGV